MRRRSGGASNRDATRRSLRSVAREWRLGCGSFSNPWWATRPWVSRASRSRRYDIVDQNRGLPRRLALPRASRRLPARMADSAALHTGSPQRRLPTTHTPDVFSGPRNAPALPRHPLLRSAHGPRLSQDRFVRQPEIATRKSSQTGWAGGVPRGVRAHSEVGWIQPRGHGHAATGPAVWPRPRRSRGADGDVAV